ncbi:hypothetical protein BDQ12DRAFT_671243 [Crucibulum laeve]|uniref:Uncharacterized protein n=1 Tax=Crucibulum laeve TaxID=68775 RepID=A0A5C3LJ29_9AGAR|nr:hypothetical protein BDQ12DRAFT_671243 [Crucibulum laeve]
MPSSTDLSVISWYRVLLIMSQYTLNVEIDPGDLPILRESRSNLCIAKKVNGVYTVVWSGNLQYFENNAFDWVDECQVFGINKFKDGALANASTNMQDIKSGQTCEMNVAGIMSEARGNTDTSGKFTVINKLGEIAFGVNAKCEDQMLPIFVWFSVLQKTGTMMLAADSESFEAVYLGKVLERTVSYKHGKWTSPD